MKFWEAMREMQENGKNVRCKRWDPQYEWHLGDDINLPDGCDWEDVLYEWEIYEEPEKTYSFEEVVKGLKDGKMFSRKMWGEHSQIRLHPENRHIEYRNSTDDILFFIEDFEANDWVEVKNDI